MKTESLSPHLLSDGVFFLKVYATHTFLLVNFLIIKLDQGERVLDELQLSSELQLLISRQRREHRLHLTQKHPSIVSNATFLFRLRREYLLIDHIKYISVGRSTMNE